MRNELRILVATKKTTINNDVEAEAAIPSEEGRRATTTGYW